MVELKKSIIGHMIIAITFFTSAMLCTVAQLLLLVLIKPFNTTLFRKLANYPCYSFFCQLVAVVEWYGGGRVRVFMDAETERLYAGKEHGFMLMNHSYEIDWLVGWMLLDKLTLLGNSKAFTKRALSYLPFVGWAWWLAEFVFLNRDFEKDKELIAKQLKVIYSYPDPTWCLLNAEGTRFNQVKHEASVKFAQERGMTPLKHHLIPRTKGFTTSMPTLRGICPAIYDVNTVFSRDAKVPATVNSVLSGQKLEPCVLVRRFPLDVVPVDEKAAAAWLQNLYVEKDRILDSFHETGSFFKTSGIKEVPSKLHQPRIWTLINFCAVATISISSILYYLIASVLAANWFGVIATMTVLLIFYILLRKANDMSQIGKASSYGIAKSKTT
ncbi:1-acyl-sn-glycerol-3-phosphate acyltransferase gamma [Drosophila grimshawi]|uniref:GH15593 n=1 Tax=Drosophila grimshawi TaxID=7222 RepID=B4J0U9_DROGR|nr:1-acyl-sn-glycerol-3-phosphate acyltransferase gamma [Drosophila grimshawi]EDV95770.1 GH15593 [Drosophila grimshawi]